MRARAADTSDVIGVEVGGAIKNVIAIAAGLCEGLGLGTNAMAALVTRGCSEMRRVVVMMGGEPSTVFGLSGVGDTFGTCFGPLTRAEEFDDATACEIGEDGSMTISDRTNMIDI